MNKKGDISLNGILFIIIALVVLLVALSWVKGSFEKIPKQEELCGILLDDGQGTIFKGNFELEETCGNLWGICERMGCTFLENAEPETCYCGVN